MIDDKKNFFINSIVFGIISWFIIFLIFNGEIVNPISIETIVFIFLSYTSLITGFYYNPLKKNVSKTNYSGLLYFKITLSICILGFLIRYLDLFVFRGLSIFNDTWENRNLIDLNSPGIIFIFASICTKMYFFPLVIYYQTRINNKVFYFMSTALFLLPFIEGYLRSSRNIFFTAAALYLIIHLFFNKIKLNFKSIVIGLISISVLLIISTKIIMDREEKKSDDNFTSLTSSFWLSKYLKPNDETINLIQNIENKELKKISVAAFQFSQYYVHGVFEFDNLVKYYKTNEFTPQKGFYTFQDLVLFTNTLNITSINTNKIENANPRIYTFITFFGCLFLDFYWFTLIILYCFGMFQNYLYKKISGGDFLLTPIFLFFIFCNFFMLTFSFFKTFGTYIIVITLFLALIKYCLKKANIT